MNKLQSVEYYEVRDGKWYSLEGSFGAPGAGFPVNDASSKFRAAFKTAGTYTIEYKIVKASDETPEDNEVVASASASITVNAKQVNPGPGLPPSGSITITPVDKLADERSEATDAITEIQTSAGEDYAGVTDEIKAVADKAAADIAAAKTEEEIKAIEEAAKAEIEKIMLVYDIEETGLVARSKVTKTKSGKDAILITWYDNAGREVEFEGVEIFRSTKRYSGFGTKPIFTSKSGKYYNTAIKEGVKYFYKVRGYVTIDGEKVYTEFSLKAIRTAK